MWKNSLLFLFMIFCPWVSPILVQPISAKSWNIENSTISIVFGGILNKIGEKYPVGTRSFVN